MDEGVVEGGVDVSDTENELALSNLGTEGNGLLLGDLDLLGGLHPNSRQSIHPESASYTPQCHSHIVQKPTVNTHHDI